jgi:hypothetical protein
MRRFCKAESRQATTEGIDPNSFFGPRWAGATIPLLRGALMVVHKKNLAYMKYANGWMLAQTLQ